MSKIFISYRREDSGDSAGRIFDRLVSHFGPDKLVRDVDSIPIGCDYEKFLTAAVNECQVLLAIIGRDWLEVKDATGRRRLDDPCDLVRIEIEAALRRDLPLIPVTVMRAPFPREEQLPFALQRLAYRNGLAVRPDPDFHRDVDRLIEVTAELLAPRWHYAERGCWAGPATLNELRRLAAGGLLQRADPVLAEGAATWIQASAIEGLFPPPMAQLVPEDPFAQVAGALAVAAAQHLGAPGAGQGAEGLEGMASSLLQSLIPTTAAPGPRAPETQVIEGAARLLAMRAADAVRRAHPRSDRAERRRYRR